MKSSIGRSRRQLWSFGMCAVLLLAAASLLLYLFEQRSHSAVDDLARPYDLKTDQIENWKAYGGSWKIVDGAVRSNSNERGAKLIAGRGSWTDYTLNADIRYDNVAADMGVTIRSNDESVGVDSYNGYFVGIRSLDGTLVIGRSNYSWVEARPVSIPGGVHPSEWYRLKVTAVGCNIAASVQSLTTGQTAWIAFEERSCVKSGRIGLRTLNANGMWRNISVVKAHWSDYADLRQHADSVEQPVILDGPPWWTPWHVGMLFIAVLLLALLTQLVYFRVRQWKALTIMHERERLAHEIHDTMAQSFAGVGYQIQGIRRSVIRGDRQDSRAIADQLSVAYQLVRRCHEEASRTITMLSTSSPPAQQTLLNVLSETARKIAGNQIEVVIRQTGNPSPLNLRLADALLHIGQEAIANAVGHSDPSRLLLTLSYQGSEVELVVEDDGQGFECTPERMGFGILGMQKRARDVGAILSITSSLKKEMANEPGGGTVIRVNAHLEQAGLSKRGLIALKRISNWNV